MKYIVHVNVFSILAILFIHDITYIMDLTGLKRVTELSKSVCMCNSVMFIMRLKAQAQWFIIVMASFR